MRPRRHGLPVLAVLVTLVAAACGGGAAPDASAAPTSAAVSAAPTTAGATAATPSAAATSRPGGTGGDTGTILVEPAPDTTGFQSAIALDGTGTLRLLMPHGGKELSLLSCGADCATPSAWAETVLAPGVYADMPLIRSTGAGGLLAGIDNFVTGETGDYLGACGSGCDGSGAWSWTKVELPAGSATQRSTSRWLATGGDAVIIGLGAGSPMSALVCLTGCTAGGAWTRITFTDTTCSAPSVAANAAGAMAFACGAYDFNQSVPGTVEVWTCPAHCATQGSWAGVSGLATGTDVTADVALAPDGRASVAVNLGPQEAASEDSHLAYLECASACGDPASWAALVVGDAKLYARRVAVGVDDRGATVIAFDGTDAAGSGLHIASCASACGAGGTWTTTLVDAAKRMNQERPLQVPGGCDAATWIADNVNDMAVRDGVVAITSGYSAIGTGGTCSSGLFNSIGGYASFRTLVSVAITRY